MPSRTERLSGTLTSWNDERGFGFISQTPAAERIFVHIKAFPPHALRPQLGDALTFEIEYAAEGKRRAAHVRTTTDPPTPMSRRPRVHRREAGPTSGATSCVVLLVFVIGLVAANAVRPVPELVVGLYLIASLLCFVVYAADKHAAVSGRWRVSERTLLLLGLVGGWPGALVAQQAFRHKTKKATFRHAFWGTVVVNVIVLAAFVTPVLAMTSAGP